MFLFFFLEHLRLCCPCIKSAHLFLTRSKSIHFTSSLSHSSFLLLEHKQPTNLLLPERSWVSQPSSINGFSSRLRVFFYSTSPCAQLPAFLSGGVRLRAVCARLLLFRRDTTSYQRHQLFRGNISLFVDVRLLHICQRILDCVSCQAARCSHYSSQLIFSQVQ